MISVSTIKKTSIRGHYDLATPFYRLLWGPHIHHGLWLNDTATPYQAQCELTDTLAELAGITNKDKVLDVGCGMGGSSIRLASQRGCQCHGVTLSPVQKRWATISAMLKGLSRRVQFQTADIENIELGENGFDVLWSVECTEHLYDKPKFFQQTGKWVRSGGRLAIVVWFQGSSPSNPGHQERVEELCQRFVCPSFATVSEYTSWLTAAGFDSITHHNWSQHAAKTWKICRQRVKNTGIDYLAKWISREQVDFLNGFDKLIAAFENGDMEYGALIARRS
jgi:tocopherol O-methyltransferase